MASKSKKRPILPIRPDPPTVQQLLDDMSRAAPDDPVFRVVPPGAPGVKGASRESPEEDQSEQGRRYLELNERLQEVWGELAQKREELRVAGEQLERTVAEVKGRAL
ncbi:hypothetical protein GN956_G14364 [Arapaima gigas]